MDYFQSIYLYVIRRWHIIMAYLTVYVVIPSLDEFNDRYRSETRIQDSVRSVLKKMNQFYFK